MARSSVAIALFTLSLAATAPAQIGGDGSDGPFTPTTDTVLDTTAGGVFQFTRASIPAGVTVRGRGPNPLVLRVQGDFDLAGTLDISGSAANGSTGGAAGPGGFPGGDGRLNQGAAGAGPGGGGGGTGMGLCFAGGGGGHATPGDGGGLGSLVGAGGFAYGAAYPFDLRGGSGGGGSGCPVSFGTPGDGGGGGGGVVAILVDGNLSVSGTIEATGGGNTASFSAGAAGSVLLRSIGALTVTGNVDASGTTGGILFPFSAGEGFVRFDSYQQAPTVTGSVAPTPLVLTLPELTGSPAQTGSTWTATSASLPGDTMALFLAVGGAAIPLGVLGTLELDPASLVLLGSAAVPTVGVDPQANFALPIPNAPALVGVTLFAQAITANSVVGRPRLTNSFATPIL